MKVSVMDVSKKYRMEYRMLDAVTSGRSWYGNWGYEFGAGSYALTQHSYQKAVDTLSSLPLYPFLFQPRKPWTRLQARQRTSSKKKPNQQCPFNALCAWMANDVEHVQQASIKLLLATFGAGRHHAKLYPSIDEGERIIETATKLLDCKQFIKDYRPYKMAKEGSFVIHLWCHVELSDESEDDFVMPPELLERGLESWTVDCTCGAKDDDGERMFACDTCGVWQHTRCAGIHSSDEIPAKFV
ncbi:hypothetical protein ACFX2C_002378 [Malus domestica]